MKNLNFLLFGLLLISGCSIEPLAEPEEEVGYVKFVGRFDLNLPSFKQVVPECTGLLPVKIRYRLLNSEGILFTQESSIQISDPDVISNEPMVFPVGTYTVDDISLLDANNVVTHSVPHIDDPIGNLAFFEDDILPMEITIMPNTTTESFVILLCNNITDLEELETIPPGFIGAVYETATAWIFVPEDSCVNRVIIEIGGYEVEILIDQPGYYSAQYVLFEGLVRFEAYHDDQFLQVWHGISDLHIFPSGCNYDL